MVMVSLFSIMSAQAQLLRRHSDYIFERIEDTIVGLSEDEYHWRPYRGSNDIEWILTHMARIGDVLIPQIIQGTVSPEGWDDDYEERPHTPQELTRDLRRARDIIQEGLGETSEIELSRPFTIWGRETDRKGILFHLLAELIHHNGQIAMLKEIYRRQEKAQ